ncbi:MAG: DUF695 domain-containing protein [Defluviitaleaceae bacterium]|nr:DUF695 domain-containing protein [Defluviitaleaceae bacterium]
MQTDKIVFSNSWEFFPCYVNNQPFSIRFDRAVESLESSVKENYPHTLVLTIHASESDEHGLPTPSALERINNIDDKFSAGAYDIRLIGVITGGGCSRFVFCCDNKAQAEFENVLETLLGDSINDTAFECKVFDNDNFAYYDKAVAPNSYEWQWIMNRHICTNLEKDGEAFKRPRNIDFFCIFDSDQHIDETVKKLKQQGFKETDRNKAENGEYNISLTLTGIPKFEWINGITADILDTLSNTDGRFDGWGTAVFR